MEKCPFPIFHEDRLDLHHLLRILIFVAKDNQINLLGLPKSQKFGNWCDCELIEWGNKFLRMRKIWKLLPAKLEIDGVTQQFDALQTKRDLRAAIDKVKNIKYG